MFFLPHNDKEKIDLRYMEFKAIHVAALTYSVTHFAHGYLLYFPSIEMYIDSFQSLISIYLC